MANQLLILELSSVGQILDGTVGATFNKLIGQAVADLKARMTDKKPRKLAVEIALTPKITAHFDEITKTTHTELVGVAVKISFDLKVPKRHTIEVDCGIDHKNQLLHNLHAPFNHQQQTLLADDDPATVSFDRKTAAAGG